MSTITTYTRLKVDPVDATQSDIQIEDVAHALSLITRANGHFPIFYSVAQHCVACCKEAKARGYSENIQLAALLHDAAEAYIGDLNRPVKMHLPEYKSIEERLLTLIWNKFLLEPLSEADRQRIFDIDDTMLAYEFTKIMNHNPTNKQAMLTTEPALVEKPFKRVEQEFLHSFHELSGRSTHIHLSHKKTVGIDWCSGKWIAVILVNDEINVKFYKDIAELCENNEDAEAIIIDIPIGLPSSRAEAELRPDNLARKMLGSKSSTIFNVLFRDIVYANDSKEAWDLSRQLDARMTPQGLAIQKTIHQVDEYLQNTPSWKNRLVESHPEVAFMVLNHGKVIESKKVTPEGENERISILMEYGIDYDKLEKSFYATGGKDGQVNDLLDAACLATIGRVGITNGFVSIPPNPQMDRTGLKMQMVVAICKSL